MTQRVVSARKTAATAKFLVAWEPLDTNATANTTEVKVVTAVQPR